MDLCCVSDANGHGASSRAGLKLELPTASSLPQPCAAPRKARGGVIVVHIDENRLLDKMHAHVGGGGGDGGGAAQCRLKRSSVPHDQLTLRLKDLFLPIERAGGQRSPVVGRRRKLE